jgi:hypothetical protein
MGDRLTRRKCRVPLDCLAAGYRSPITFTDMQIRPLTGDLVPGYGHGATLHRGTSP